VLEKLDNDLASQSKEEPAQPRIISIDSEQSFKEFFNRPLPKGTLMQC